MEELINMIPKAEDVRKQIEISDEYLIEMKKVIKYQNDRIQEAKERGEVKTCFSYNHHEYVEDIKKLYSEQGYSFQPTGFSGGVLQKTIDICW